MKNKLKNSKNRIYRTSYRISKNLRRVGVMTCRGAKRFILKRANEFSPNDIENEDLARQRRVLILSFRRSAPRRNAGFMGCFSTVSMELGAKGTRKEEDKGFALELE